MIVLEAKLYGNQSQYQKLDEMIRTASFVRNSCLRYWMDHKGVGQYDLSRLCKELAQGAINILAKAWLISWGVEVRIPC